MWRERRPLGSARAGSRARQARVSAALVAVLVAALWLGSCADGHEQSRAATGGVLSGNTPRQQAKAVYHDASGDLWTVNVERSEGLIIVDADEGNEQPFVADGEAEAVLALCGRRSRNGRPYRRAVGLLPGRDESRTVAGPNGRTGRGPSLCGRAGSWRGNTSRLLSARR